MIPIPATYIGLQYAPRTPAFALWTIWRELPGHPYGSTLSDSTLRALGYEPVEQKEPQP